MMGYFLIINLTGVCLKHGLNSVFAYKINHMANIQISQEGVMLINGKIIRND